MSSIRYVFRIDEFYECFIVIIGNKQDCFNTSQLRKKVSFMLKDESKMHLRTDTGSSIC